VLTRPEVADVTALFFASYLKHTALNVRILTHQSTYFVVFLMCLSYAVSTVEKMPTVDLKKKMKGHSWQISALSFHPTAPILASASWDRTVCSE
jgi:WD40 repeat protein